MRWMFIPGVVLCVLLAALVGSTAAAAPQITFPQTQHTFTPVVEGETVTHEFVVRNQGDAELEIYKVRTG